MLCLVRGESGSGFLEREERKFGNSDVSKFCLVFHKWKTLPPATLFSWSHLQDFPGTRGSADPSKLSCGHHTVGLLVPASGYANIWRCLSEWHLGLKSAGLQERQGGLLSLEWGPVITLNGRLSVVATGSSLVAPGVPASTWGSDRKASQKGSLNARMCQLAWPLCDCGSVSKNPHPNFPAPVGRDSDVFQEKVLSEQKILKDHLFDPLDPSLYKQKEQESHSPSSYTKG